MAGPRRRNRPRFVLAVLVLTSVTVVTFYYRGHINGPVHALKSAAHDVISPIQRGVGAVLHPIEHFLQGATSYGSLQQANARLRQENERLQSELKGGPQAEQEAAQLKQQAGLTYIQGIPTVPADVIDMSPSNFEASIEIDKGTSSGVAVGMPVVSGTGLVGRVVEADRSTSIVRMITDFSSATGVRFDAGNGQGTEVAVASGQGQGNPLKVDFVDPQAKLSTGQLMTTSGLQGGLYPADIPVGEISKVSADAGSLQQRVTLRPLADLGDLLYVTVLEWEPVGG